MLYDSPPKMSEGGFKFHPARAKTATTEGGDSARVLGAVMNPKLSNKVERDSVEADYTCDPRPLDNFIPGNVVALNNPFYDAELEDDHLPLYVITTPYKIKDLDYKKYKLEPLNDDLNYVRVHGKKEEKEATLLTGTGRAQPTRLFTVPDVIVADTCGFAEEIVNRRI